MQPLKLMIVVASTRPTRAGEPIARWLVQRAASRRELDVTLVDLKALDLPLMDEPEHPRFGRYVHGHTKRWSALVDASDAFVFVMPEYNHGYTAPLKNAIDYLHREWADKPVGFASYGGVAAGTRAVQLLKPVLTCLAMMPLTAAVAIPMVASHVEDGQFRSTKELDEAAELMLDQLERHARAIPRRELRPAS
jgi:NAD(P)H-dependent FMN reductase